MKTQYIQLRKDLFKFYTFRIIIGAIFLMGMLIFKGQFFYQSQKVYRISNHQTTFNIMANILQKIQAISLVINDMADQILSNNMSFVDQINNCGSNVSQEECLNSLNTIQNQLLFQEYKTYRQFRCLKGQCRLKQELSQFYWTLRIQNKYIEHILIDYQQKNIVNQLIHPPDNKKYTTFESLNLNSTQQQIIYQKQSNIIYSRLKQYQQHNLTIRSTILLNSKVLESQYGIYLNQIIIYLHQNFLQQQGYQYYIIDDSIGFGVNRQQRLHYIQQNAFYVSTIIIILLYFILIIYFMRWLLIRWENKAFSSIYTLDNLYKYQLNQIFQGQTCKRTAILNDTNLSDFYEDLSYVIDKDYQNIPTSQQTVQKQQKFKFIALIDRVLNKFENHLESLGEQRFKQIANLKFMIKTSSVDISQSVNKKLVQHYKRARQLFICPQFFYFAYLSLLSSPAQYQQFLQRQKTPLPYINSTINSHNIKFAFKFACSFSNILQKQLIMKIQFSLLQKYYANLKQLDFGGNFARQLGLQRQLRYLQENMENKKYLFATYLK